MLNRGSLPNMRLLLAGKKIKIPDMINEFSKQLITECWSVEPNDRLSFEYICTRLKKSKYEIIDLDENEKSALLQKIEEHNQVLP